jgi:hypothetical protein
MREHGLARSFFLGCALDLLVFCLRHERAKCRDCIALNLAPVRTFWRSCACHEITTQHTTVGVAEFGFKHGVSKLWPVRERPIVEVSRLGGFRRMQTRPTSSYYPLPLN